MERGGLDYVGRRPAAEGTRGVTVRKGAGTDCDARSLGSRVTEVREGETRLPADPFDAARVPFVVRE
jgi:hypothetical protein